MTRYVTSDKNLMLSIILILIIFGIVIPVRAQVSDTISVNDTIFAKDMVSDNISDSVYQLLPGVDVSASKSFHTPDMSVYIPTRREKNVATDATHLLQQMQITQLRYGPDGSLVSESGKEISYFIDGHPAQEYDLQGMNTRDVNKVRIMENPADARYLGKEFVVEFIMQRYEYGGYTKFSESAYMLGMYLLNERLTSRITYKRMTFDLYISALNSKYDKFATKSSEIFRLRDGVSERDNTPLRSKYISNKYPIKFRADYSHGNTYISNQIGYQYNCVPEYGANGNISLKNGLTAYEYDYSLTRPNNNQSVTWDGYASFILEKGWSLSASGNAYFTHYDSDYEYVTTEPFKTDRRIVENSLESKVDAVLGKRISDSNSVNLNVWGLLLSSHSSYHKDIDSKTDFLFPTVGGKITYNHFTDKIYLTAYAGMAAEWNKINGNSISTVYPYGVINLRYSFNRKNTLSLWTQYTTYSATADDKNPTLIEQNELFFIKGNPDLKSYKKFELSASYTWSPSRMVDITGTAMYTHFHDKISYTYTLNSNGASVLQSYVNKGNTDVVYAMLSGSLNLLDGNLKIAATPYVTVYRGHHIDMPDINSFGLQGSANYYFGSFYIGTRLKIQNKEYTDYEMNRLTKTKPEYTFYAGWGNSHWSAVVYAMDIFRRSWNNMTSYVYSPVYESSATQVSTLRRQTLYVTLTYTFGYGKKINRSNELRGDVSKSQSTVLQ